MPNELCVCQSDHRTTSSDHRENSFVYELARTKLCDARFTDLRSWSMPASSKQRRRALRSAAVDGTCRTGGQLRPLFTCMACSQRPRNSCASSVRFCAETALVTHQYFLMDRSTCTAQKVPAFVARDLTNYVFFREPVTRLLSVVHVCCSV